MRDEQWGQLRRVLAGENETVPFGVIVDSPWIPGYCGVSTLDFFARPETWLEAYRKIRRDFPSLIFLPDYWVEFGMATEVSGFGCRLDFFDRSLPDAHPVFASADEAAEGVDALKIPDPRKNGLMPLVLNLQRYHRPRLEAMGEPARMVCARGPFTIGSYLLGVTEFLVFAKAFPDEFARLTDAVSELVIRWLEAQLEAVGTAEAVMVLDDVCGFFSPADFEQLALPCLRRIFAAFPDKLHFFHNDMTTDTCARFMERAGVDALNTTYLFPPSRLRELLGGRVTLMGNFEPMLLTRDDPSLAAQSVKAMLDDYRRGFGSGKRLIVSPGGGMPIGARRDALRAAVRALEENAAV